MCTVLSATTILECLDKAKQALEVFTAFDITQAARIATHDTVLHNDVRGIIENEFVTQQMTGYDRELCTLNIGGSPQAQVYFPDGKSASDHDPVSDSSVSAPVSTSQPSVSLDDDEYKLTSEGRINIPKELLDKATNTGGSFDVMICGTLACVTPNSDGRVRLCLRNRGVSGSKVKLTVDVNGTINLESV